MNFFFLYMNIFFATCERGLTSARLALILFHTSCLFYTIATFSKAYRIEKESQEQIEQLTNRLGIQHNMDNTIGILQQLRQQVAQSLQQRIVEEERKLREEREEKEREEKEKKEIKKLEEENIVVNSIEELEV